MLDRLGREIRIGELVAVKDHPELSIKVNWVVLDFLEYTLSVDVVLQNFISGEIRFINILDIEKEFF